MSHSEPTTRFDHDESETAPLAASREECLEALRQIHGPEVAGGDYGSAIKVRLGRFLDGPELANTGTALIVDVLERMRESQPVTDDWES